MKEQISSRKDVTLTITEACNLNCTYCYEEHKSKNEMSFETAKRIIDYELSVDDGKNQVTIDFFGGEPFMNFELIKEICQYTWSKEWPKQYIFFATTNGTLIHEEIANWITENKDRFWLGLSIDGNEYMQNINRCNSFSQVDLGYFLREWPEQAVKMTISKETLPHLAEGCIFLHEKGFKVTCNLAYGLDWSDENSQKTLSHQLMKLIEYYVEHPTISPCSMLDRRIEGFVEKRPNFHKWCGAGTNMRVYSITGEYYPCQFFMPLSVGSEKASQSGKIDFENDDILRDHMCDDCILLPICPTCYGSNYARTGDISKKDKSECEMNKLIILANSYFRYRLLTKYTDEELGISIQDRKCLTDAIVAIQNFLGAE
ncbi:MAG: radical SAM protein [Acutalibacter sp.]|nr:radical SAM protein [Acutalibacter sp.]